MSETLTASEAAKVLKISKYTLYELVKRGEIPAHHIGRQLRIDPVILNRYLKGTLNLGRSSSEDTSTKQSDDLPLIRFIGSHDPVVELLFEFLKYSPTPLESSLRYKGSLDGLIALYHKEAEITGIHLWDEASDDYNISFVKHVILSEPVCVVNLAQREQGFIVAPGNPYKIETWQDIGKEGIRFINRQSGSGTRLRFEAHLQSIGINSNRIIGYEHEETTHTGVAFRIASKQADVGIGLKSVATYLGLEFVPLFSERYDLVCLNRITKTVAWHQILDVLNSSGFINAVRQQGGYDTAQTGKILFSN